MPHKDGEGPVRPVRMSGFALDQYEVRRLATLRLEGRFLLRTCPTVQLRVGIWPCCVAAAPVSGNLKFRDFVEETSYVTDAERLGDSFVAELYLSEAVSATIRKKAWMKRSCALGFRTYRLGWFG